MRAGADNAGGATCGERLSVTADVPSGVIGVPFRRGVAASSAGSVAFSFIHTNDMPVFLPVFLPVFGHVPGFPFVGKCFKTPTKSEIEINHERQVFQMRIAMIGTGYVGLVSGACFA